MRWLRPLVVVLTLSLLALGLWESLSALRLVAVAARIAEPDLWPWIVDGFIIAMALARLDGVRQGRKPPFWIGSGMWIATAFSGAVQVMHAPDRVGDQIVHAVAPIAVLWSFEALMWVLGVKQRAEAQGSTAVRQPAAPNDPPNGSGTVRFGDLQPERSVPPLVERSVNGHRELASTTERPVRSGAPAFAAASNESPTLPLSQLSEANQPPFGMYAEALDPDRSANGFRHVATETLGATVRSAQANGAPNSASNATAPGAEPFDAHRAERSASSPESTGRTVKQARMWEVWRTWDADRRGRLTTDKLADAAGVSKSTAHKFLTDRRSEA